MKRARVALVVSLVAALSVGCQLVLPLHERSDDAGATDAIANGDSPAGSTTCASSPRAYADEVKSDQPSVYLRLGERSGPTAVDETGSYPGAYPSAGIVYGAAGALSGDPDTAITVDGAHGIAMPAGLDFSGTAPFTVELWAKPTDYPYVGLAVDHNDWRQGRFGWSVIIEKTSVSLERWNGTSTNGSVATSDTSLGLGTYHHVVATFDGAQLSVYIDARLRGHGTAPTSIRATGVAWTIGAINCVCSPQGFVGSLDEFAVYPTVLSEARIAAHYCAATKR